MIADGPGFWDSRDGEGKANAARRYLLPHWVLTTVQCAQSRTGERLGTGIEFMRLDGEIRRPDG